MKSKGMPFRNAILEEDPSADKKPKEKSREGINREGKSKPRKK